jgi:hypothetical protein
MRFYQVTFEGVGYNIFSEENQKIGGFFVSVLANAPQPEQAFEIAYQKLINSQAYQNLVNENDHPSAYISVYEYCEVTQVDLNVSEVSAFVFYPPDDQTYDNNVAKH